MTDRSPASPSSNHRYGTDSEHWQRAPLIGSPVAEEETPEDTAVRFELPFNLACRACLQTLFRDRTVIAEKSLVGMSGNHPIFAFLFPCPTCANSIEIRAGSTSEEFNITYGASMLAERPVIEEEETTNSPPTAPSTPHRRSNAIAALEKNQKEVAALERMKERVSRRHGDSVSTNRLLRSAHRVERKAEEALVKEAKSRGLAIPLLPFSKKDERQAERAFAPKSAGGTQPPRKLIKTIQDLHRERQYGSIFGNKSHVDPKKQKLMEALSSKRKASSAPHR